MNISEFKVETWLNPLDDKAKHNLGSSCVKPVTFSELFEITGADKKEFYEELENMSLHYGYFFGMPRLKEAIAGLYTDAVTPDMVLCVHGGTGANSIVCYTLCDEGDNIVSILPNYQQFYSIPEAMGIETRRYVADEKTNYEIDMKQLRKLVDKNTKMINLANPNNPTGYTLTRAELEELVEIAREADAYVVCDEIYRGLSEDYMYSICDLYEKGICTSSTSKVFSSAGTRVGWIVSRDESIIEDLLTQRSYNTICEGPINELLAAIILEHADIFYERSRRIVEEGRTALGEWLKDNPHFKVTNHSRSSTSLLVYDFDIPAEEFAQGLYDATSTLVCHGGCFEIDRSFRIGYGFGDVDYFKAGLTQITRYVKECL